MPLPTLNLDDRRFQDLVEEAQRHIRQYCPQWTDLSPSEPGTVLLEAFAHLTEVMIYRLNRVPEKAYREFLRLLGVKQAPPSGAVVALRFTLKDALERSVEIPRGTRVASERPAAGAEAPVFATAETLVLAAGQTSAEVIAYHCEQIEAELVGKGTGLPGLSVQLSQPPVIAPTGDRLDLVVGVETPEGEPRGDIPAREYAGKTFAIWREVDGFSDMGPDDAVYVADRSAGTISFAPALRTRSASGQLADEPQATDAAAVLSDEARAMGATPGAGREIRVWYRRGGGASGNVAADTLKTLKDPIPAVHLDVTNPTAATGGRDAESLENALARGPIELHSLRRAVTARDFELLAVKSSGGISRAHAYTKAMLWRHARPGTVEVILVPHVPPEVYSQGAVTPQMLAAHETQESRTLIQGALDQRRPLGTTCLTSWCRYKTVQVRTRVRIEQEEDEAAVRDRILHRLYSTINPLPQDPGNPGWPFGQSLSAYHVYKILGEEPGVKNVEPVKLRVENVPGADVQALAVDAFQPNTWYAGAADAVFRSVNNAAGWERVAHFPDERMYAIKAFPQEVGSRASRAGLLAAVTQLPGSEPGSRIYFSHDCGESWIPGARTRFVVEDMAWTERDGVPTLLLATEVGLYELAGRSESVPVQVLVDPEDQNLGFYAIAVSTDVFGETSVAVAARARGGVYLSTQGGKRKSFKHIGLKDEMVRVLAVQHQGPHRYLWAGLQVVGVTDPGTGAARWALGAGTEATTGWERFDKGWAAGGCQSLAFLESTVFAASTRLGVMRLDTEASKPAWEAPDVKCGLPLRELADETGQVKIVMERVEFVAAEPQGRDRQGAGKHVMAGGRQGVYLSRDRGKSYKHVSSREFADEVTLPPNWLFCSAEHDVKILTGDQPLEDAETDDEA